MSKAQKRKKPKKPRRPKSGTSGGQPPVRINQSIADVAKDNVAAIIGQGRVPERAREIATSAFFLADHLTGRLEAEQTLPHPIACQEGCDCCCYNQVELTPPEAMLIGHYIARQFSEAEKDLLLAHITRIIEIIARIGKAGSAARRREIPCPLLGKRTCSVYPVRPLVCRAMHSLDRERCEVELRTGCLTGSTYYPHRHEIAVSVSAGVQEGCRAAGLQGSTLNLARALHDFFRQENPVEKWLNGEEVFTP
jgi:Fe-S-cluster containining protein